MRAKDHRPTKTAEALGDFAGHVPDRSRLNAKFRVVNYGEFLTRLEPRTVQRTEPGQWESTLLHRPGEPTEHGIRMKLLDLEREQETEKHAGIGRVP